MYCKTIFFLFIDATLASDNLSRFRKNLLERIQKLIITINDKIRDKKLPYDINRVAVKISALSSGKIDKYDQRRVIEQAKFAYFPLGKALEKRKKKKKKAIEEPGKKKV